MQMTNGSAKPSTSMVLEMLQKPSAQSTQDKDGVEGIALLKRKMKNMKGAEADRMQQLLDEMTDLIGTKEEFV